MFISTRLCVFALVVASALCLSCSPATRPAPKLTDDAARIREALEKWPRDFAARDVAAVCGLFAPDVTLIYQGGRDNDYAALCSRLTGVLTDPETTFLYDAPDIKEIIVKDDLAVVRLIWTARIRKRDDPREIVEKENGIDVFRRQGDGSWKIHISHAFPQ